MYDNKHSATDKKDIGFLHKICKDINHTALSYWINNKEFSNSIQELMESGVCIDSKMVFNIMRDIYIKYDNIRKESLDQPDFNFYLARRAVEGLSEGLTGDKDQWNNQENKLSANTKFGFLYKKISLPRKLTNDLLNIKEFTKMLQEAVNNSTTIDNMWFYNQIKNLVFPMMEQHSNDLDFKKKYIIQHGESEYKTWWHTLRTYQISLTNLSKQFFDNKYQWLVDYEIQYSNQYVNPEQKKREIIVVPDENKDMEYILNVCDGLHKRTLRMMVSDDQIIKAFREYGEVSDIQEAFGVFKTVFYNAIKNGDKNSDDIKIKNRYYKLRDIAENFSDFLYSNKSFWHHDYNEYLKS